MRVSEAVAMFLDAVRSIRAPATTRAYAGRLVHFSRSFGDVALAELTAEQILTWIDGQKRFADGTEKAPDTVRLTITSVEQLQAWLIARGHLSGPWIPKQKKPGGRKRELLPSPEETKQLLAKAPADFVQMYRALRLTGARPGELVRATIADLDRRQGLIILQHHKTAAKTGATRKIAVGHAALQELLTQAIGERTAGPIFLRSSGQPWSVPQLSSCYRRARKAAGLPEGLVLYLSRHEHATQLYKSTGDLKAVADALGHTNIQTTMRYTRTDAETLQKNQQLFKEGLE